MVLLIALSTLCVSYTGFLNYEDFQAQALGVGAYVSAVTLLFWLAVILLVVYTQNIILVSCYMLHQGGDIAFVAGNRLDSWMSYILSAVN